MGVWLVAHLVRDEGVAGSNPATPTSFLVAPIHLRGQLCGTKHTSDNLAPPIPIHFAPSGGGRGCRHLETLPDVHCELQRVAGVGCRSAGEARNIRLFFYCCGPQPTLAPSPENRPAREAAALCAALRPTNPDIRAPRRPRKRSSGCAISRTIFLALPTIAGNTFPPCSVGRSRQPLSCQSGARGSPHQIRHRGLSCWTPDEVRQFEERRLVPRSAPFSVG
jgi:hypothetical protein